FLTYDLDVFVLLPQTAGGLLTLAPIYEALKQRGCEEEGECLLVKGMPVQFLPAYEAEWRAACAVVRRKKSEAEPTFPSVILSYPPSRRVIRPSCHRCLPYLQTLSLMH
ncbi:MAG: hypothetical protein RLZZ282_254, partial [Verrucomicrobiota bacterium]